MLDAVRLTLYVEVLRNELRAVVCPDAFRLTIDEDNYVVLVL